MRFAGFETLHDAAIYRHNHGGWLFVNDWNESVWFDAAFYTPTVILRHRAIRGQNGNLICDDRYYKPHSINHYTVVAAFSE